MSVALELFFKKNHKKSETVKLAVTNDLCDNEGNPLIWELRKLDTKTVQSITKDCTHIKYAGKNPVPSFDEDLFVKRLITESVVFPDLNNAELQDSYGVKTPEDLIVEMVSTPGDFISLGEFVSNLNNLNQSMDDRVQEAKN